MDWWNILATDDETTKIIRERVSESALCLNEELVEDTQKKTNTGNEGLTLYWNIKLEGQISGRIYSTWLDEEYPKYISSHIMQTILSMKPQKANGDILAEKPTEIFQCHHWEIEVFGFYKQPDNKPCKRTIGFLHFLANC